MNHLFATLPRCTRALCPPNFKVTLTNSSGPRVAQTRLMNSFATRLVAQPSGATSTLGKSTAPFLLKAAGIAGVGIGVSTLARPEVHCDASPMRSNSPIVGGTDDAPVTQPSSSFFSAYQLTFGATAGICAGIFLKKGAKIIAWCLGGTFVLLQYLASLSIIRIEWKNVSNRFESLFYTVDSTGASRPPTPASIWRWLVGFLTTNFQSRASFIGGLALGLRIG